MPLIKSKGNMYEWVKTWNPLGGECPHKCSYCSTNNLKRFPVIAYKYSGELRIFSDLYKGLSGKPKTIFVVGQNDLFANEVETKYIQRIIQECNKWKQHTYFFQTKNPERYLSFLPDFPKWSILCTTIETNRHYSQMGFTPATQLRAEAMSKITEFTKHVTVEPVMQFDLNEMVSLIRKCNAHQINLGSDSKRNNLPEPPKEKILELISELEKFTVVKQKSNLSRLLK